MESLRRLLGARADVRGQERFHPAVQFGAVLGLVEAVALARLDQRLESRVGTGFKTPLATLHSHNGWADKFLATPDAGLEDINLKAVAKLPADLTLLARYHWFSAEDVSVRYGTELDLQLTYQYDSRLSFSAKAAFYEASSSFLGPISQDTDKYWLQAEFVY